MKAKTLAAVLLLTVLPRIPVLSGVPEKRIQNLIIDVAKEISTIGNFEGNRGKLEKMAQAAPDNDAVWYYLGICQMFTGQADSAENSFLKAAALDSTNTEYREKLAALYSATGRNDKAARIYLGLLEQQPRKYRNAFTLTLLADQELSERKDSLALVHYDEALLYDPSYPAAQIGKAELYRMQGRIPDFFVSLKPFVTNPDINPEPKCDYVRNVIKLVNANTFRAWHAQLDELIEDCAEAHPADSNALFLAGSWFYSTGRKEKGKVYFNDYLTAYPDCADAHFTRIQILADEGDDEGELEQCRKVLEIKGLNNSEKVMALSIQGDAHHRLGDEKAAFNSYDRALEIDPEYVPVLNNYAYFLSLKGRKLRKAEQMSRKTVEKFPENATYLDTYGWILHLLHKDAEAEPYFKKAMLYGGASNAEVLSHYAIVLECLGQKDRAAYYRSMAENKK